MEILTLDGNGRFLIPRRYQKMAAIAQAIKFVGMDDTIEIWQNDEPDKAFMDADGFSEAIEEVMSKADGEDRSAE